MIKLLIFLAITVSTVYMIKYITKQLKRGLTTVKQLKRYAISYASMYIAVLILAIFIKDLDVVSLTAAVPATIISVFLSVLQPKKRSVI